MQAGSKGQPEGKNDRGKLPQKGRVPCQIIKILIALRHGQEGHLRFPELVNEGVSSFGF